MQLKLKKRVNILKLLSGTGWGASATTLRTTTISLIQSVAHYCSTSWEPSSHKVMFESMRIISGLPKSTELEFLPQVSNLQAPEQRRNIKCQKIAEVCTTHPDDRLRALVEDQQQQRRFERRKNAQDLLLKEHIEEIPTPDSPWGLIFDK